MKTITIKLEIPASFSRGAKAWSRLAINNHLESLQSLLSNSKRKAHMPLKAYKNDSFEIEFIEPKKLVIIEETYRIMLAIDLSEVLQGEIETISSLLNTVQFSINK